MRYKVLTVDDSKTVRIIVRKAFRPYDCDVIEAGNGVEGLAVAAKEQPALILLDVTMPVMDGVEMLTKLKADPALKGIPVIMLTAEGGREHVLKIAKIGVRDYLVKPFKEEVLIEKCGRVLELKPLADAPAKARSIFDPADLLIVEDKPAIIQQIQEGLKHTPWKIKGVATQAEAIAHCATTTPDLVMVSLSLPEDTAFGFLRHLRTSAKMKYLPAFALVVKTETAQQQQAQSVGFSAIITKPIDTIELESKIAKAMNLDTSLRYFTADPEVMVLQLPENCAPAVLAEISGYLKPKFAEAVDAGINKVVLDVHQVRTLHMGIIKLLFQAMQTCRELAIQYALVGHAQIVSECKGFEDTRSWSFFDSVADAKGSFQKSAAPQLAAVG